MAEQYRGAPEDIRPVHGGVLVDTVSLDCPRSAGKTVRTPPLRLTREC